MALSDTLAVWGLVVGVFGVVLTIVGFVLAIAQLRRTATAAEATTAAITSANRRMLLNHILVLVPQLKMVEADLDVAMVSNDLPAATRSLIAFGHAASQIAALLESESQTENATFITELRQAASDATVAKGALVSGNVRTLRTKLGPLAVTVSDIAVKCSGLTAQYQSKAA